MIIEQIIAGDRAALLTAWSRTFKRPAPKGLSQNMLRRLLAFEVQAKRQGGLSKSTLKRLTQPTTATPPPKTTLQPGGRLIREWNGTTHIVEITDGGFLWRGQTWRSLSVIAREITGAHWSGPRFFGLAKASA